MVRLRPLVDIHHNHCWQATHHLPLGNPVPKSPGSRHTDSRRQSRGTGRNLHRRRATAHRWTGTRLARAWCIPRVCSIHRVARVGCIPNSHSPLPIHSPPSWKQLDGSVITQPMPRSSSARQHAPWSVSKQSSQLVSQPSQVPPG